MQAEVWKRDCGEDGGGISPALRDLVVRIAASCRPTEEWQARVGAGLDAAVDYVVEDPGRARALLSISESSQFGEPFWSFVESMTGMLEEAVPLPARPDSHLPAAAIAGVGLLVEAHVRTERCDRLPVLRPELHLLILLPFLDFAEAKGWVYAYRRARTP